MSRTTSWSAYLMSSASNPLSSSRSLAKTSSGAVEASLVMSRLPRFRRFATSSSRASVVAAGSDAVRGRPGRGSPHPKARRARLPGQTSRASAPESLPARDAAALDARGVEYSRLDEARGVVAALWERRRYQSNLVRFSNAIGCARICSRHVRGRASARNLPRARHSTTRISATTMLASVTVLARGTSTHRTPARASPSRRGGTRGRPSDAASRWNVLPSVDPLPLS